MKFRANATERAIYRLLSLLSTYFFISAFLVLVVGIIILINAASSDSGVVEVGQLVGLFIYLIGAAILTVLGLWVHSIRNDMVE